MALVNKVKIFEGNAMIMASTPLQAEAYAPYQGMCEAYAKGVSHALFKSDCAELVRAIESQHQPFEITTIIHDIKAFSRNFNSCEIAKVNRIEVDSAHVLARAARQGNLKP